jgi:hypothetical protein
VSVATDVSLAAIKEELEAVAEYASAAGLQLSSDALNDQNLRFILQFENQDGESFYAEFDCAEYPLYPPTVEFVNEDRSEKGAKRLYPQGFHPTPCICMRYNRKAYAERGGPHGDWRLLDWRLPSGNGIAIDSLALMVSDLHSKIRQSTGRMS